MTEVFTPEFRRLPGRASSQTAALRKFTAAVNKRHEDMPDMTVDDPFHSFYFPDPEKIYRWRIQLDCGCISETLTYFGQGEDKPPMKFKDGRGHALPEGQALCGRRHGGGDWPYREIIKWEPLLIPTFERVPGSDAVRVDQVQKVSTREPDPEEPPSWWGSAEGWDVFRRTESQTLAWWTVTLSCGHQDLVGTDVDWKPSDGHRLKGPVRTEQEFREEFPGHAERLRPHDLEHILNGFPDPDPQHQCLICTWAHSIVAYEPVGWLKSPPKPPAPPTPEEIAEKATKKAQQRERRIKSLEAELAQLRAEGGINQDPG